MTENTADTKVPAVTATTPLPTGWRAFCSRPDSTNAAHWYATAPYDADALNRRYGCCKGQGLSQTVDANTWRDLHQEVARQVELYEALTAGLR